MGDIYKHYFTESLHSVLIINFDQNIRDSSSVPVIEANPAFLRMFDLNEQPASIQDAFVHRYSAIQIKLLKALGQSKKNIRIVLPEIGRSFEIGFSDLGNNLISIDFLDVSDHTEELRLVLAEQALLKSQKRYSLLFNEMKNIFVSFRIQERNGQIHAITYSDANPSFEALIGCRRKDFIGQDARGHFIEDDSTEICNKIYLTYLTGQPEHFIMRNSRLGTILDASVYRFDDTLVAMIASNITELKQTEEELRLAKDKAEESERLKSSFLANMSHEIRTPLNGILGFSKLLARNGLSEEKKNHYISLIDNNGNHLMSIISDILDIAKIESNQLEINCIDFNLNPLFDSLMEMSNTMLSKKETEHLSITTSKGLPSARAVLHTDPMRLTQILRNLLENAIKFTQSGSVNFGYKEYGDSHLYFYVKDTGIGISKENLQVIFQHFRQEDETITRRFGGTGLGLSICKHLVKHLGGEIGVESEKGKGSTFYFILPYKKRSEDVIILQPEEVTVPTEKNTRIACCSTPGVYDFFARAIEKSPIELVACQDVETLKAECMSGKIQAAIIDVSTPSIRAAEILSELKHAMPFFQIFATSANLVDSDRSFYSQMGYTDIFDLQSDSSTACSRLRYYLGI